MEEFDKLFGCYTDVVYRYLLSLCGDEELAQELTSETFCRAYLHIGSFRGDCKPETWLCSIAKHALYKERKRRQRHAPLRSAETLADARDAWQGLQDKDTALRIHRHLHALPEPYREVFTLRVFGELKFKEIADICGRTETWAKVTYYRAKDKLQQAMEEEEP